MSKCIFLDVNAVNEPVVNVNLMAKTNKQSSHEYWLRNKAVCAQRQKRWREQNLDYYARYRTSAKGRQQKRRYNSKAIPTEATTEYRIILEKDPCCYCGGRCEHIDHIVPKTKGGLEQVDNLTAACARCNTQKHARTLLMFLLKG